MRYSRLDAKDYAKEHMVGLWSGALTPFNPDGTIDEAGFRANMRYYTDVLKLEGMFTGGLMNEFWALPIKDRKRLFDMTFEEGGEDMLSLLACCDLNIYDAVELAQYAENLGAHFVSVLNPRFYTPQMPSEDKIVEYYTYIAERINLGILIFNQPQLVGYLISPQTLARLADIPNIVAVKNVAPMEHIQTTRRLCGDKILVSDPDETTWFQNHAIHGQRALVAAPTTFLLQMPDWQPMREYTNLIDQGDLGKAAEVAASLEPARRSLSTIQANVTPDKRRAALKYWMELQGQVGGSVRPPMSNLNDADRAMVREQFELSGLRKKAAAVV